MVNREYLRKIIKFLFEKLNNISTGVIVGYLSSEYSDDIIDIINTIDVMHNQTGERQSKNITPELVTK